MEMEGLGLRRLLVCMVVVLVMMITLSKVANAEVRHDVGGNKTNWAPNVNLSDWSSHKTFYVGEWLYFGFDKSRYNVLEVNETSYEKCMDTEFIRNITKGGRDVFQLAEPKTYYFLSGGGYCFHGMKVAVKVQPLPPTPGPTPPQNGNAASLRPSLYSATHLMITPLLLLLFTATVFLRIGLF